MQLREYQPSDCEQLAELFYQTVHSVNAKDYTKEQLDVWATDKVDLCEWNNSFLKHRTIVAVENGKIVSIGTQTMPIPHNGYVIVGPNERLSKLYRAKHVDLDIKTIPNWDNVKHIISGGPYLVKNGEVFVDMTEQKLGAIGGKNPRTAIGYTQDGNFIMVAVDGREGASVGLTLKELAWFMKSIDCINAMNLDGGGSTVMYVNGRVVNMPKVKGGIALSNALTIDLKS